MKAFDDSALRAVIDLRDAYEATLEMWRALDQHEGSMFWRSRGDRQYLVHRQANRDERSLGPRSPETERSHQSFQARKQEIKRIVAATPRICHARLARRSLVSPCKRLRTRLPLLASELGSAI